MNAKETTPYNVAKRVIELVKATDFKATVGVFNKIKKENVNRKKIQ